MLTADEKATLASLKHREALEAEQSQLEQMVKLMRDDPSEFYAWHLKEYASALYARFTSGEK